MQGKSCGTHDGIFHADEVTACALLLLFKQIQRADIIRTRDRQQLARCAFVCDVGGIYDPASKRFDHHQRQYQGPLSSAGMVLLYLQQQGILSSSCYRFLNDLVIRGIDAEDRGDYHSDAVCSFSQVVASFVPLGADAPAAEQDRAFFQALTFVHAFLQRSVARHDYLLRCQEIVRQAMADGRPVLFFERAVSWMENFFLLGGEEHPARFVVMPAGKHWKLRAIPPSCRRCMEVRQALPAQWAGLSGPELQQASGVLGAIFCHKRRFISIWETKEDALQALQLVLKDQHHAHAV